MDSNKSYERSDGFKMFLEELPSISLINKVGKAKV